MKNCFQTPESDSIPLFSLAVTSFDTLSSILSASKVMSINPDTRSTTAKNRNIFSVPFVLTILSEQVNSLIPISFLRSFLLRIEKMKINVPKIRSKMPLTRGIVVKLNVSCVSII